MTKRALLVFTRSPEAEARAKGFAPQAASGLFGAFLASWKRAAESADARLLISSPPQCARRLQANPLCEGAVFLAQSAGRFGERLASAVESAFALGYSSVAVVPGDTPAISGAELGRVYTALEDPDPAVVVGPAIDGGVYLIGLQNPGTNLLAQISLRNSRTCEELISSVERAGRKVSLLAGRGEVDSLDDLKWLSGSSELDPVWNEYGALLVAALGSPAPRPPDPAFIPVACLSSAVPARAPPAA